MTAKTRVAIVLTIGLLITAALLVPRLLNHEDTLTASGTVEATEADLGFQIPGRVSSVRANLGDVVSTGDTVATLDARELLARSQAAEAQLSAAQARLNELTAGFRDEEIAQARAAARAADRRYQTTMTELARSTTLFEGGAISREMMDTQETARDVTEAEQERTAEVLRLLEAGARPEQIAAARAAVRQAQANVAVMAATLDQSTITAPFSGRISVRYREPGEIVAPGTPVVSVTNLEDRWVRVYVRENAIGRLALGRRVVITADTYVDKRYGGEIVFISSEAEFTPSNVQTTEERVTLVYEVRIRITEDETLDLKPGIAADVLLESVEQ